jgi:AbiU2
MPMPQIAATPLSNVEVHRLVRSISIDLDLAIAAYETYVPSGQDAALIDRMNKTDYYPAFNVISDALHRNVLSALCRIWDTRGGNPKLGDTADLSAVEMAFRDPAVIADLASAGHVVDSAEMSRWFTDFDAVKNSKELLGVKSARHNAIAHTASPNPTRIWPNRMAPRMLYGYERQVIEWTIPLVEQAGAFIGYSYVRPYAEQRRIRQEHAAKFWTALGG